MSNQTRYLAPDGKVYVLTTIGATEEELPQIGYDDLGNLQYFYYNSQEFHQLRIYNDDLQIQDLQAYIGDDGYWNSVQEWTLLPDAGVTVDRQKDLDLLRMHNKRIKLKVELLDSETYLVVDSLVGIITGYPSYEIDSESDIRRTCNVTLLVDDKSQMPVDFEKTWNKRMVELSCGIYDEDSSYTSARKDQYGYVWYKLGRMQMESGSTTLNATTQEIKLNLVDLMASLTEERGSQIGTSTNIPVTDQGVNIRTLLINVLGAFGVFKQYSISEFPDTLPYDLDFDIGIYPIEIFIKILSLFPSYEMFYDVDGIFTVQQIPTHISDPVDVGADVIDELLISETTNNDFSVIKNTTEVWGRVLECEYAGLSCTTSNNTHTYSGHNTNTYNVNIDSSITILSDGDTFSVIPNSNSVAGQYLKIYTTTIENNVSTNHNLGEYQLYYVSGNGIYSIIPAGEMKSGMAYSIRYFQNKFILEGELVVRCIVQEVNEEPPTSAKNYYKSVNNCNSVQWIVNEDSPYACTINPSTQRIDGEIKQVLHGGEYDDIYTIQLAYERAKYENWLRCRLQDSVTIDMILVPWMDVNQKIQYTSPVTGELGTWIVRSISYDFQNWTMSVNASRFYPSDPWAA